MANGASRGWPAARGPVHAAIVSMVVCGTALAAATAPDAPAPTALWPDAPALESFLKEAKITEHHKLGQGITNPEKVTLEKDGVVRHAVFKDVNDSFDSWRYEVAAYEMDKLLGLGMVPPTVERRFRGRRGCLQLWVEGVTMEKFERTPPDPDAWRRQVSLMWLFDEIVANIDRHANNVIVTPEFRLALIDNSKTFSPSHELLNGINLARASGTRALFWLVPFDEQRTEYPTHYPAAIVDRVRSITADQVKAAVGRYLSGYERDLILERRDLVVRRLEEIEEH